MLELRSKRSYIKKAIGGGEGLPPEGEAFVAQMGGLGVFDKWKILEGTAGPVLEAYIATMKVVDYLRAIPGVGEITAYEALFRFKLPPTMRFVGLTYEMRVELSQLLQEAIEV